MDEVDEGEGRISCRHSPRVNHRKETTARQTNPRHHIRRGRRRTRFLHGRLGQTGSRLLLIGRQRRGNGSCGGANRAPLRRHRRSPSPSGGQDDPAAGQRAGIVFLVAINKDFHC